MLWFIVGIIVAAIVALAIYAVTQKGYKIRWFEWLIGAIGLALAIFTVQNVAGSLHEAEPKTALMIGLILGAISLLFIIVAWSLSYANNKAS